LRRTSLQRVFVRPKHLYTRRPLSLPRTVPSLHVRRPRVVAHRTFSAEATWDLAPAASCLSGHHAHAASSPCLRRSRCAALLAPSKPSAPKHDRPCLRHRWSALLRWAAPARQNSHDSKNSSVSVRPTFRRLLGVTVAAREPKPSAWPGVDKASEGDFPNRVPTPARAAWWWGRPAPLVPNGPSFRNVPPPPMMINLNHMFRSV
jgi:hypothetical protein